MISWVILFIITPIIGFFNGWLVVEEKLPFSWIGFPLGFLVGTLIVALIKWEVTPQLVFSFLFFFSYIVGIEVRRRK